MSNSGLPGGSPLHLHAAPLPATQHLHRASQLRKLLNFSGWSIDDVVNNRHAKNDLLRWYKLTRWTDRRLEIRELEKQWNPLK